MQIGRAFFAYLRETSSLAQIQHVPTATNIHMMTKLRIKV